MLFANDPPASDHAVHSDRDQLPFPSGGVSSLRSEQPHQQPEQGQIDDQLTLAAIAQAEEHIKALSEQLEQQTNLDLHNLRLHAQAALDAPNDPPEPPLAA